jgi:opacity protein-like surface antigen
MRLVYGSALAIAAALLVPTMTGAQAPEAARPVAGGGITVAGWTGKVDATEEKAGQTVDNAKFAKEGNGFRVTTGPAVTFWNPANKAAGNYTVKATFNEPKYMGLNDHPHPYGIVIGGNDLGTPQQSYMYCAAYGNGNFIVRGFGPDPFQMNGRRGETNAAVNKATAPGQPVTQEIAVSVKGDRVECSVNGTVVAGYDKSALVTAGKLKSTDGLYGLRFAHNTEAVVTGLTMTKN